MAGRYLDILGTLFSKFRLGLTGPYVGADSGDVSALASNGSDYAALRAALVKVFGDDIILNEGASGSDDDWSMTLSRPDTGMTEDLQIVLPPGVPAPGQALTVAGYSGGVITLEYTTLGSGNDKVVVDTTSLAFGDSSPVGMFTKPANAVVLLTEVIIDTAFDGTPSLSVGISGSTSKYMPSTAVDLTAIAGTSFEYKANEAAVGTTEGLITTFSAGSASVGAARILVHYVIPS
jgi:hypothetical protein